MGFIGRSYEWNSWQKVRVTADTLYAWIRSCEEVTGNFDAKSTKNKIKTKKKKWDFQQNIILAKSNHLGQFVNEQHKTKQNNCALDKKKTWNRTIYAAFQLPNNLYKITSCEFLCFSSAIFLIWPNKERGGGRALRPLLP